MTIFLTVSKTAQWNSAISNSTTPKIISTLQESSDQSAQVVDNPITLNELGELSGSSQNIVICYESPVCYLSRLLVESNELASAIEDCVNYINCLLKTHRLNRAHLSLLNFSDVANSGERGLRFLSDKGWTINSSIDTEQPDAYIFIAYRIIEQTDELRYALEALQASSLVVTEELLKVEIVDVITSLKADANGFEEAKSKVEASKSEIAELQREISGLKAEQTLNTSSLAALNENIESDAKLIGELQSLRNDIEARNATLEATLAERNAELELSQERFNELQSELDISKRQCEETTKNLDALQNQRQAGLTREAELESEKELVNQRLQQLQGELETYLARLERSDTATRRLKVDISNTERRLQLQLSEVTAERDFLKHQSVTYADEFMRSQALEKANEELENSVNSLTNSFAGLEEKLREKQFEIGKIQTKVRKLEKANKSIEQEKADLKSKNIREIKKLERELSGEKSKHRQLEHQFMEVSNRLRETEYELSVIKKSAAWKITAPARAVSKKLRKDAASSEALRQDMGLLYTSDLFNSNWYLETYPDIAESGMDPAEHYLLHGAKEGRLPSVAFDGDWYLQQNPDVAEAGLNPLIHYIKYGLIEKRAISPKLLEKR